MTNRNKGSQCLASQIAMFVLLCASLSSAKPPRRLPPSKFPGIDITTSDSCGYFVAKSNPFYLYDPADYAPGRNRLRALWIDPKGLVHAVVDTESTHPKNSSYHLLEIDTGNKIDSSEHPGDFDSNLPMHVKAVGGSSANLIKFPEYLKGNDSVLVAFSDPKSKGDLLFYDKKITDGFKTAFLRDVKTGADYELPYPPNIRQFFSPHFFYVGPTLMMAGAFRRGAYLQTYVMRIPEEPQQRREIRPNDIVVLGSFDHYLFYPPIFHWTVNPSSGKEEAQLHVITTEVHGVPTFQEYTISNPLIPEAIVSTFKRWGGLYSHYSVFPQSNPLHYLAAVKDDLLVVKSHEGSFRSHRIDLTPLHRIAEVRQIREISWHSYSTFPLFATVRTMGREKFELASGHMMAEDTGLALVSPSSQAVLAYFPLGEAVTDFPMAVHIDSKTGQGTVAFTRNGIHITVHHFHITEALRSH